jgi:hypothetical protein
MTACHCGSKFAPFDGSHTALAPEHLLLGSDALTLVRGKLSAMADEIQAWETLTHSTDG